MRITHVLFGFPNAGQENLVTDIVNIQAKTHQVSVIILNDLVDYDLLSIIDERVSIYLIKRAPGSFSPVAFFKFYFRLIRSCPGIFHFHEKGFTRLLPKLFISRYGVLTIHNTRLFNRKIENFSQVVAVSEAVFTDLVQGGYSCNRNNLSVVSNGIHVSRFACKESFVPSDPFRLIQLGRIEFDQKGQDILVEALKILKCNLNVKFRCDFVGEGSDKKRLKRMIDDLGLGEQVNMLGNKPKSWVHCNLQKYDVLILPSRFEGFGLVITEAMAARVPVLITDLEGPRNIVRDERYGFFIKNLQPNELAEKIKDIYNEYSSGEIVPIIENAFSLVNEKFSIEGTVSEYEKIYLKTKGRKSHGQT